MIRIIDKKTGEDFDLPKDFKISIEDKNPLFSEHGGPISLPVRFEHTDKNKRLLDFSLRLSRTDRPVDSREVIIMSGLYQAVGNMKTLSISERSGYTECVIVSGETNLYARMKETSMQKVFENEVRNDFNVNPSNPKLAVAQWVNWLDKVMCGDVTDDFNVYPVCCSIEKTERHYEYYNFINHQGPIKYHPLEPIPDSIKSDVSGRQYYALNGNKEYRIKPQGSEIRITIPVGYGVSPFLKFSYVLKKIFAYFGFELSDDYLQQYPDFANLNVLNNTYDAIMFGKLYYHQLVPTCSVYDFLKAVRLTFGCEFVKDKNSRKVSMLFYEKIFEPGPSMENIIAVSKQEIGIGEAKNLKLSSQHTLRPATWKDTIRYFQEIPSLGDYDDNFTKFVPRILRYQDYMETVDDLVSFLCSDVLDWFDASLPFPEEERGSKRETVYMERIDLLAFRRINEDYQNGIYKNFPYVGKPRILNTMIRDSTGKEIKEPSETKCPIMFAFPRGRHVQSDKKYDKGMSDKYFYGSTHAYNAAGDPVSPHAFNLNYGGERGLYEKFWKRYDLFLRNDVQTVRRSIQLDADQVADFDMLKLYVIDNQIAVFKSIKYEIQQDGIENIEAEFVLLKTHN